MVLIQTVSVVSNEAVTLNQDQIKAKNVDQLIVVLT